MPEFLAFYNEIASEIQRNLALCSIRDPDGSTEGSWAGRGHPIRDKESPEMPGAAYLPEAGGRALNRTGLMHQERPVRDPVVVEPGHGQPQQTGHDDKDSEQPEQHPFPRERFTFPL